MASKSGRGDSTRSSVLIRVSGRVQGVGFRYFVARRARALEVFGWVRNESDGAVLLIARGRAEAIERLVDAIRIGPPSSRVQEVEVQDLAAPTEEFPDPFEIRY